MIGSAAAGLRPADVEIYSIHNSLGMSSPPAEDAELAREYVAALVGAAYRGESRDRLAAAWKQVEGKLWAFPLPADDSHYWQFSRNFGSFDPLMHWAKVKAPFSCSMAAAISACHPGRVQRQLCRPCSRVQATSRRYGFSRRPIIRSEFRQTASSGPRQCRAILMS